MGIQSWQQVVHLVVQTDTVVEQAVENGVRTADKQVVDGILVADAAVGL